MRLKIFSAAILFYITLLSTSFVNAFHYSTPNLCLASNVTLDLTIQSNIKDDIIACYNFEQKNEFQIPDEIINIDKKVVFKDIKIFGKCSSEEMQGKIILKLCSKNKKIDMVSLIFDAIDRDNFFRYADLEVVSPQGKKSNPLHHLRLSNEPKGPWHGTELRTNLALIKVDFYWDIKPARCVLTITIDERNAKLPKSYGIVKPFVW